MPKFRNVSSLGDLDLPLVGRVIAAGESFEVDADAAELLSAQPGNWELVTEKGSGK